MRQLCLILTPPSGPWKDLSLHFDVELPHDWPTSPPSIKSSVNGIQHPNLYSSFICCDLLRKDSYNRDGYTGGYSPALTLRGLFLQFLTFFSSTKVEQEYGSAIEIGDFIIARYYREKDVAQRVADFVLPGNPRYWSCDNCCEEYEGFRLGNPEPSSKMEQEWAVNPSPEVVVGVYDIEDRTNPKWGQTLKGISKWTCRKCPYGSAALPHHFPPAQRTMTRDVDESSSLLVHAVTCVLENIPDDIFFTLAAFLPSEAVLVFSEAYPRFRAIMESAHELLLRELQCFFLRTQFHSGHREEAFQNFGVRKSIQKRAFQYFLPLAFSRPHFLRARDKILSALLILYNEIQQADRISLQRTQGVSLPRQTGVLDVSQSELLSVIYRMVNNIVVALMKSCDGVLTTRNGASSAATLLASEKAVYSYCHLFHLLLCLSRSNPNIYQDASKKISDFIAQPGARVKARIPDLGEFIVLVTLVLVFKKGDVAWCILNGPFLEEAIVRNARWVLRDHPELEAMEEGRSDHRLNTTFNHSKTSLRLMMFQITFLTIFVETYSSDLRRLDDNYGFAEKEIPERMVKVVKEIYKVGDWPTFFEKVQYVRGQSFGPEKLSQLLRDAVKASAEPDTPRKIHLSSVPHPPNTQTPMKDTPSCRILTVSPSLDISVNLVQQIQRLSQPPSLSDSSTSLNVTNETEKHLPWTISNKYYAAEVHFLARQIKGLAPYHLQGIPALIFVWEKGETYKHHIHRLSKDLGGSEPEVSLAVRVSTSTTPSEEDKEDEDEASEDANAVDEFLSSHGFEFVDASSGREQAEGIEGISNGIPSLPRVLDALSTIMWPSMQTSQKSTPTTTRSQQGNDAFLDWAQLSFDNSLDEDNLVTPTSGWQSDHRKRLHKEMNELAKWLQEEGEELKDDNDDPWKVTGSITSPTEIDDDMWGTREKSTVKTGVVDAFDDDFSVFVSAPAETETRQRYTVETADNKVSFDASFDSSFDFDRLGPSPLGMTYHALGSGSDLGDPQESGIPHPDTPESEEEDEEEEEEKDDLPSKDEIRESAQRIFGAQGGASSSDDFELAPFDIGQVMNALQGMKAEIADIEEESERRKAAARIALGLVYGLERDAKVEEDFDLGE
ncbi:hypothetical protein IW262DRAFT_1493652 [Armillaria fumosa]|nr:hypothetical protein IW262DRAFT_1493652 [Armillaria fumosa]